MSGQDGFQTSNEIARYLTSEEGGNLLDASYVCIANGAEVPKGTDALAGAALAGKNGGVVLLANTNASCGDTSTATLEGSYTKETTGSDGKTTTETVQAFLPENAASIQSVNILGGAYVMPQVVIDIAKIDLWNWRKVTFNSNEGSSVADQKVWKNTTITKPTDPTRTGFVFNAWYKDSGLTQAFDFTSPIKKSTTLYAKWVEEKISIAEQEIAVTGSFTYNGSTQTPTVTVKNKATGTALVENTDYTVGYKQDSKTVENPTNAGTYTVVITAVEEGGKYTGSSNSNTFTIARATPIVTFTRDGASAQNPVILDMDASSTATDGIYNFISFDTEVSKVHPAYTATYNGVTVAGTLKFLSDDNNNSFKVTAEKEAAAYLLTFEPNDSINFATITGDCTTDSITAPVLYVQVKDLSTDATDVNGTTTIKNPADKTNYKVSVTSSNDTTKGLNLEGAVVSFDSIGKLTVKSPSTTEDVKDFVVMLSSADTEATAKGGVSVIVNNSNGEAIDSGETATEEDLDTGLVAGQYRAHNNVTWIENCEPCVCTAGTRKTGTCKNCTDNTVVEKLSAKGHIKADGSSAIQAYGLDNVAQECDVCGHVLFGVYEQDANDANGKEAIEWVKLPTNVGLASEDIAVQTLMSLYGLDAVAWNKSVSDENTWNKTCHIRDWLNSTGDYKLEGGFYTTAFTADQQSKIVKSTITTNCYGSNEVLCTTEDDVFLLSSEEAKNLSLVSSSDILKCTPTAFALTEDTNSGDFCYINDYLCDWYLRSPGFITTFVEVVLGSSGVDNYGANVAGTDVATRPVVNLML